MEASCFPLAAPPGPGSLCLSYRVQSPGGSLVFTLDSPTMELKRSGGGPLGGLSLTPITQPGICLEGSGTLFPLCFQLQTPGRTSPWGVWSVGGQLSRLCSPP